MSKERTSISIERDVYEFLQQPEINQSGLIQELVREYKDNQDRQVAALEMRLKHLDQEIEDAEERLSRKREQREDVRELLSEAKQEESAAVKEAKEAMDGISEDSLTPDNPAVKNWSRKLDMTPEALIEVLKE